MIVCVFHVLVCERMFQSKLKKDKQHSRDIINSTHKHPASSVRPVLWGFWNDKAESRCNACSALVSPALGTETRQLFILFSCGILLACHLPSREEGSLHKWSLRTSADSCIWCVVTRLQLQYFFCSLKLSWISPACHFILREVEPTAIWSFWITADSSVNVVTALGMF